MNKSAVKHIVALLFLVAFLLPRIANLHAFSHISEDEEPASCELCHIISSSVEVDLEPYSPFYIENDLQDIPSSLVVFLKYDTPQQKIASPEVVYNKPPPFS